MVDLGPSFFCQKTGNFVPFLSLQISTFHEVKTRTSIRILRLASLHSISHKNMFESVIWNIEQDILV